MISLEARLINLFPRFPVKRNSAFRLKMLFFLLWREILDSTDAQEGEDTQLWRMALGAIPADGECITLCNILSGH